MKKNILLLFISLFCLSFICIGRVQAQEQVGASPKNDDAVVESDILWLWGEVSSIDSQNKSLAVKYFDYETDQEKEMTVAVDNKTIFENIKSFDEIKPQDTVSIDYIAGNDGKNIAKNISIEKPEISPEPQAPLSTDTSTSAPATAQQASAPQVQPKTAAQDNPASSEPQAAPQATQKE